MVFPVESEDRTMRNLLMLCQDNTRLIVEAFRKVLTIIDNLPSNKDTSDENSAAELNKIHEQATLKKYQIIKELVNLGGVLVDRDDFYRLVSTLGDQIDKINGIATRLIEVKKIGCEIPENAAKGIADVSNIVFQSLSKLREAMTSVGYNSEKAISFTNEIDALERKLDNFYIKAEIDIITSSIELPTILLLKDIIEMMENLVDMVRASSDLIRIIAV